MTEQKYLELVARIVGQQLDDRDVELVKKHFRAGDCPSYAAHRVVYASMPNRDPHSNFGAW
jgi:hypothetical protein